MVLTPSNNVNLRIIQGQVAYRQLLRQAFLDQLFPLIPNPYIGAETPSDSVPKILNDLASSFSRFAGNQQTAFDNGASRSSSNVDASTMTRQVEQALNKVLGGSYGNNPGGFDALPGREVCAVARRYRLPMLVDVVGRLSAVEMLASQYPDLNFIIPHLGGFKDDWMTHTFLIDQLRRFPNVYADTSGVRYWDCLLQAVKRAGPHKIIFGSDGPLLHPGVELYKIKMLRLPTAQERLIMGGNIVRLLGQVKEFSGLVKSHCAARVLHRVAVQNTRSTMTFD